MAQFSKPLFGGRGVAWSDDKKFKLVPVGDRLVPEAIFIKVDSDNANPELKMKIEVRQGIPIFTEVTLKSNPGGPDIRDRDLKNIYLDNWLREIVAEFSESPDGEGDGDRRHAIKNVEQVRKGRSRMSPEYLERVAKVYRDNVTGKPTDAVRRAFGLTPRTAARYVSRAREAGLLPPTDPGVKKA